MGLFGALSLFAQRVLFPALIPHHTRIKNQRPVRLQLEQFAVARLSFGKGFIQTGHKQLYQRLELSLQIDINHALINIIQSPLILYLLYIYDMKASTLVLVTLAIAAATLYLLPASDNLQVQEFRLFKSRFNRVYDAEEEAFRFKIFTDNLKKIEIHNADETQTYKMGVTQFADMTTDEFIQKILVNDLQKMDFIKAKPQSPRLGAPALPDKVDWRQKGVVNPVKNQGGCGSCWAFSTTGTLQSAVAIQKSTLLSFSEQQLVDCCGAKGYQCQGCSGAWPEWALNYVAAAGITLEREYPYTGRNDKCRDVPTAQKYLNTAKPWTMLAQSDLWTGIASTPVSVCLDASNWSLYKSGIFSNCGTTNLNHAVTAIGFDQAEGSTLIRNSWGTSWGEQGHIRLKAGNTCGVASHALIANLA